MTSKEPLLEGYMRKLKTMKKKYFALFGDCDSKHGCLKYYDSKKKYEHSRHKREPINPKRCIVLEECFSINRKLDTKYQNVLALYMRDECFSVVFEEEEQLLLWLNKMLQLQVGVIN